MLKKTSKKSMYLCSEAWGFTAGGGANYFFAKIFFLIHDESNEPKKRAAPCPAATEMDPE